MAFMKPFYTRETFYSCEDKRGEGHVMPAEIMTREAFAAEIEGDVENVETIEGKWWARLSAPGYMDCTEWSGPFDSEEIAKREMAALYEVDPDTGASTRDSDDEE